MTQLAAPVVRPSAPRRDWLRWRRPALASTADAAVVAALAWWATGLTLGTGGREPRVLTYGLALVLVAAALVRPWRLLPLRVLALGLAPGVAAWVVVATAPTGWAGADEAASLVHAGALGLVAWAWARTPGRRQMLLSAVVGAAGLQFAAGWLPWWGLQDPARLFQGTFYWHNQAGVFLAAGAVLALALVADGRRPLALLGWCLAPLCVAGTVFTTSRGSLLGLALGMVLVATAACAAHDRWRRTARVAAAGVLSWGVTAALTGPPFFAERVSPTAATSARAESFTANGVQRIEDWRRAWEIFMHWPATGAGFNSFDSATTEVTTKRDGVSTAFAHNGYLQAAADGGLMLLVPLVLVLAVVGITAVRSVGAAVRAGDLLRPGAFAAYVVLLLHSGMDFDWAYPSLLAQLAIVAVLCLPVAGGCRTPGRWPGVVAVAAAVLLAGSAVAAWGGGLSLNAAVG